METREQQIEQELIIPSGEEPKIEEPAEETTETIRIAAAEPERE